MDRRIELSRTSWWQNAGALAIGLVLVFALWTSFSSGRGRLRDVPWVPGLIGIGALIVAGYRARRILDLDARTLGIHHSWLVFPWTTVSAIGEPVGVRLLPSEVRGSGKSRRTVWPVQLVDGMALPELAATSGLPAARAIALRVARAAGVPLHDASAGGAEIVRQPDEAERPAVERIVPEDLAVMPPERPRVRLSEDAAGLLAVGPVEPLRAVGVILAALASAAVTAILLWVFLPDDPVLVPLVPLAAAALEAAVLGIVLWRGLARSRLRIRPAASVSCGSTRIAAADLVEVAVVAIPGRDTCLRLVGRGTMAEFGRGVGADELRFVRAVVLRGLRG